MKLERRINIIFTFLGNCIFLTLQLQYYDGERFVKSRHRGIGLGLCFPPFFLVKGQEKAE